MQMSLALSKGFQAINWKRLPRERLRRIAATPVARAQE